MDYREEKDSLGIVKVPKDALYGAQTQRAIDNFPISGIELPRPFIRALGLIKASAARANAELGDLPKASARAIEKAALSIAAGNHDAQFPVDVFQTGSGTSSNMNANEVIAALANQSLKKAVHPNDHVNMGQSSNDVIPSAIHISSALLINEELLPALEHASKVLKGREKALKSVVKTGRTHLMDAMPITLAQELSGWRTQLDNAAKRLKSTLPSLYQLAQGGTAVGTGINSDKRFGRLFAAQLEALTGLPFKPAPNYFERISSQDTAVELSGQLKTLAVSLMKISNDLRWMNSGPLSGLGEIELKALQPGSSIMPGKVNPVIPEATAQVAAQVIGNDSAITVGGQSGNFQLNVMLPMIAHNLLQSLQLLANAVRLLADDAIADFKVNQANLDANLDRNPILVTALNSEIGYAKAAEIAKQAYKEKRPILEVAAEQTSISEDKLRQLLDPKKLT